MGEGALEGVRVIDVSQDMAGSFCARLLADYGAEVIKVEPPGGAALRRMGPFHEDDPHPEQSLTFLVLNLNKLGVTLDIECQAGRGIFRRLVQDADIVVETFTPGYLASLGLDHGSLEETNPRLIMTSISPFGQEGPYSRYHGEEIVSYAMGAAMSVSGTQDREPLKHGGFQAQYEAGLNAAAATSMALLFQGRTGEGQHLDISTAECVGSTMIANQSLYAFTGSVQARMKPDASRFGHPMPCKDGWVILQTGGEAGWSDIAGLFGTPELLSPHLHGQAQRGQYSPEMDTILLEALADRGKWDLFRDASRMGILSGVVQTPKDLDGCPQLEARGFYREVDHPVMGRLKVPAVLLNLSLTPYQLRHPAPLLGQDNPAVYCDRLGYTRGKLVRMRRAGVV